MVVAKTDARGRIEADNRSKEKKVAQLQEFVSRFGAGTRASQVQSRMREIEKLQPQDLKKSNIQRPYVRFIPSDKSPGQIIMKVEGLCKSYDDLKVIQKFSMEVQRGDKIAVIGNNGRGKSTLVKMLAGVLEKDKGKLEYGHQVQISYFPQNHGDIVNKKSDLNSFDWLKERRPGVFDQDIRGVMGKMLFGGDDAFKKVSSLSGGETARLIIAGMMLSEHNVLILDEPNGHLDLEAVSALGWGLNEYKGTVIVVSHDRDLINHCANKIIAFEADGIHFFDGKLDDYLAKKASK
jgi:ATPase subunit of ABC transporter with duplicated ATPase domains